MFGQSIGGALRGIEGFCIQIEVQIGFGMSNFFTVGLAEGAVRESKVRVRSAFIESGLHFPTTCVTLNLAPADIRKDGSAYDLPIALAILCASGELGSKTKAQSFLEQSMVLGELALNGDIRPIRGALPLVLAARKAGLSRVIIAPDNAQEAALVTGIDIFCPQNLRDCYEFLAGSKELTPYQASAIKPLALLDGRDMADVSGQHIPKRALEIAASGGHNSLFIGPPGSGKTMLAQRLPSILPPMALNEALEVTALYSVSGNLGGRSLITQRPFRNPHHSISDVGLAGGGSPSPKPGEISLAHHGVLFLDELPEFRRNVLEVLRQPLESGSVNITRRLQTVEFPAQFMLIASMNACPCGHLGSRKKSCACSEEAILRYQSRISGPLLDRIDIQLGITEVSYDDIHDPKVEEQSQDIRARVAMCRAIQDRRFDKTPIHCNAQMGVNEIRQHCVINEDGHNLMRRVIDVMGMSARAYHRILKVARTIADMEAEAHIATRHLHEAIAYRRLDRKLLLNKGSKSKQKIYA